MPRPRSLSPSKFWHSHKQQWCVKIDGRFHYLGTDEQAAEAKRCVLIAEWLAGEKGVHGMYTLDVKPNGKGGSARLVSEVLAVYVRHAKARYDRHQLARIQCGLDAVDEVAGTLPAAEFGPKTLKAVRDHLLSRPSHRGKPSTERRVLLSRNYVNSVIGTIQTAWAWLASEEIVPADRALALRTVKALRQGEGREVPHIVAISPEVVAATLPYLCGVVRAMVQFQQLTGCRPSEVCCLRPCDLSRSALEKITVPGTKPPLVVAALEVGGVLVWLYVPASHKTLRRGKRRVVPVGPRAQAVLQPFLERPAEAYCFSALEASDAWRDEHGRARVYGEGRQPGERYTAGSYRKSLQAAIRRANEGRADPIPVWSPATLRKAAASLSDEKADRDTTASLLGHSTPQMSAVYAAQAIERAARFVAEFG